MVHSSAWQSDGLAFYTGMVDGKLARWSVTSSTPDWILPAHTDGVDDMAFFDGDRHLITQGRDGQTKIRDLRTLTTVLTIPWGALRVIASSDGQQLAVDCKPEKKSHLYRFTPPPVCTLVRLPPSPVSNSYYQGEATVLPDNDGKGFAVTSGHDIHLLDRDGTLRESLRCGRCDGSARDPLSPGFVRIRSANRKLQIYRVPPGWPGPGEDSRLLTGVWPGNSASITNHPVTNQLLLGAGDRLSAAASAILSKLQFTPLKLAALETGAILSAIACSRPLTGATLRTFRHPTSRTIRGIGISPDGTRLVAIGSYRVQVWRLDAVEEELGKYGMTGPL